ncbi:alpha/beta-hydrolase [Phellopilus nigrolimitatus]|nr:alpha/beta-hydrolase [Phellopilus nigrolimitatus]
MQTTNSKTLTSSDGTQIYADAVGNPENPCIVFIHGLALSGMAYDNIFSDEKYSSKFYLVRYDMRGHGRSGKPDTIEGYASRLYADDFAAVVKGFNLRKPVVVGWSLGATVIADIAAHLTEGFISGAVNLAGSPYIGSIMAAIGTPFILDLIPKLMLTEDATRVSRNLSVFMDSCFNDPDAIPWETQSLWRGMATFQLPHHRRFVLSRPQDGTKLFEMGERGLPLLIMVGTKDTQVKGECLAKALRPHFVDMDVCFIKDGSHTLHLENTVEMMDGISAFVRKLDARRLDKSR